METIGKSAFLSYLECPTLGWMTKNKKIKREENLSGKLLSLEWKNVRNNAYQLFPDAIDAQSDHSIDPVEYTLQLLQNHQTSTILKANFKAEGFFTRIDIVKRLPDGSVDLFAVKSGKRSKLKYIADLAFASMIVLLKGININSVSIMHVSEKYRLGMPQSKMFFFTDCTQRVESMTANFLTSLDIAAKDLSSETILPPRLAVRCKNCPVFDECAGKDLENSIFDLPHLYPEAADDLIARNILAIKDIPKDFELSINQQIVVGCVENNSVYVSHRLKAIIESIKPPFYYLDFESLCPILPIYPNTAPHTQILTQFSIHKCLEIGVVDRTFEYIADPKINDEYEVAKRLVEDLGNQGAIFAYADFEKRTILRLADDFEDLREKLLDIVSRIVDLEEIIRENYYDIRFRGRSSIKTVLPILINDMSYDDLEISQGGDAAAAFAFMAMGLYDEDNCRKTKENLLKYCAQDTMSMVRIHQFLANLVGKS